MGLVGRVPVLMWFDRDRSEIRVETALGFLVIALLGFAVYCGWTYS